VVLIPDVAGVLRPGLSFSRRSRRATCCRTLPAVPSRHGWLRLSALVRQDTATASRRRSSRPGGVRED